MNSKIYIFDPTVSDSLSKVRGIGRYLQILKENFSKEFVFINKLPTTNYQLPTTFINPFFNFLQPPLFMKRVAEKQIAVIHDLIPLKYPQHFPVGIKGRLNILLNKLALKNYDAIITDSFTSKKDIITILRLPENKIHVIYPCLPNIFSEKNSEYSILNTPYCIYVGDATWNKNLVNLAKAIKILNITCIFVGKVFDETTEINHPWQKELGEFMNEIKDDKRFILIGFIPDNELINLYQQASVNILPSWDEGFGFSYLEAASLHCSSVLSNIPVLKEISDNSALFFNPKDPHEIANIIGEIYFNQNIRKKITENAYKRSQFFSSKRFKKSYLEVLKNM